MRVVWIALALMAGSAMAQETPRQQAERMAEGLPGMPVDELMAMQSVRRAMGQVCRLDERSRDCQLLMEVLGSRLALMQARASDTARTQPPQSR